jgi:hypothetical protein
MSPEKQPAQAVNGHDTIVVDLSSVEGSPENDTGLSAASTAQTYRHPKSKQGSTLVIPSSRGSTIPAQILPLTRRTAERARQARLNKSALLRRLENAQMEEELHRNPQQQPPASEPVPPAPTSQSQPTERAPRQVFPAPHQRNNTPAPAPALRITTLDALPPSPVMSITALASEDGIEGDPIVDDDQLEEQQDEFDEYNDALPSDEEMAMDDVQQEEDHPPRNVEYRLPAPPPTTLRRTGQPSPSPTPREHATSSTTQPRDKPSRGTGLPEPVAPAGSSSTIANPTPTQPTAPRHTSADKGKAPAHTEPANNAFARI